jgi:hypothetical protein
VKHVNLADAIVSFKPQVDSRASSPFELVHLLVLGPITLEFNKFQYFVIFLDDHLYDMVVFNESTN